MDSSKSKCVVLYCRVATQFGVNACGDKLLSKEAVTLIDFFSHLAAHIGQMEKVIFVHHKKAAVPQGSHCMAHAGL